MSYKATNGVNQSDSQQWKTASLLDTTVKFAGEEAKDRLYEPKHKKKLVRVLTVVAYVFFVSLAAIMLSLYYVFLWNGDQKIAAKYVTSTPRRQRFYGQNCDNILAEMQQQFIAVESEQLRAYTTDSPTYDENTTESIDYDGLEDLGKTSPFIKKLMGNYEADY
ncbi:trp-interacting inaF-D isoform X2 [Leptinotarsa decemlineata]|uniref:trp-interacting inaF-D isoform X2 n=1 Tax=Leptinotarsa decemlineata TaxID=7539 RepID=UPI003D309301